MGCRLRIQLAEALGPVNRWYCSQCHGYPVTDPELLLIYFIRSGGAENFARRYNEAMSPKNRWYCSEYYGRDIRDPQILWDYYNEAHRSESCIEKSESETELSMAS
ncbi:MAG TPA: hypothetical protein VH370_21080 [Humisphaera sp.]|jgi:hypothetical protein|nr:hypothetical protein [Humisphaera sp.]